MEKPGAVTIALLISGHTLSCDGKVQADAGSLRGLDAGGGGAGGAGLVAYGAGGAEFEPRLPPEGSDPSAGGQGPVYVIGDGEVPEPCPGVSDPEAFVYCGRQIIVSGGLRFEPGSGGAGGATQAQCSFPYLLEARAARAVAIDVDCEPLFFEDADHGDESWRYDDLQAPTVVILGRAVCSRLQHDGFERIDLRTGSSCRPFLG
jgi:hypothetical protein